MGSGDDWGGRGGGEMETTVLEQHKKKKLKNRKIVKSLICIYANCL